MQEKSESYSMKVYCKIDTWLYAFYTAYYEYYTQVFFAPIGNDFYHVAGGFGGFGMDGSNNVHDEIRFELWCQD
jgi:hypothetical protein